MTSAYQQAYEQVLRDRRKIFAEAQLETVLEDRATGVQVYRLKRPGTSNYSVTLIFSTGRIIIHGDGAPCRRGVISDAGYDLGWFTQKLDYDYLAEKFLEKVWCTECVEGWIREALKHFKGRTSLVNELKEFRDSGDRHSQAACFERMMHFDHEDLRSYVWDNPPEHDYPPHEVATLQAIQERFTELYLERGP